MDMAMLSVPHFLHLPELRILLFTYLVSAIKKPDKKLAVE